ncbi:MAG: DPP IV N-terminal domain-containing protein [Gemmatimonas sp.]|uniref:DPP IV N-terminal domain-containing protein n=1 Tax=Gemmatimonas sp. TaxID=1962908 RepID=UPI00391EFE0C
MRTITLSRVLPSLLLPAILPAQGTAADYRRADSLAARYRGLAIDIAETPRWISPTRFWYRKSVPGGNAFVLVDATARTKAPAFDHARIAAALSHDTVRYTAATLPFSEFRYDGDSAITFAVDSMLWRCRLAAPTCATTGRVPRTSAPGIGGPRAPDIHDSLPDEGPSPEALEADEEVRRLFQPPVRNGQTADAPHRSPDGSREAAVRQHNVYVRTLGPSAPGPWEPLSFDGRDIAPYSAASLRWSPDGTRLVAWRVTPGDRRLVKYVLSSPADQLQPRDTARVYEKPGDVRDLREPVLFDVRTKQAIVIDRALFPNPYSITQPVWRADSRAVSFEYNERGHQVYRILEADAATGAVHVVLEEQSKTFIYYNTTNEGLSSGKRFRYDVNDGRDVIWMSERDGWNHLYLMDGTTGAVKQQITSGPWVVRHVQRVDTVARQIWFAGNGRNAGEDPYLLHHYRVNFDGTGLVDFTPAAGNHSVTWSDDRAYYVDQYSQVDKAPVSELRRTVDQSLVMTLEQGDLTALLKAGWRAPEVFVAKARDGVTDIWGVVYRPSTFDPRKRYPVIENIYAGPQGSFVPKSFSVQSGMRTLAELGFIVVQIDGLGTSNRSKAFHDVAFRNLADAGFPDRIRWHQAYAARAPWYYITRVGIYGTSAGGQNALGGLLFHPSFYTVAFSAAGCHDNRMDKMWWNEQWMGWPIGPHYAASSNTEHAARLQGKLLLVVGEYDTNVDPASTMQVVNALITANKTFDLLVIPNAGHTSGGPYGDRKRNDFFVHHLLGVEPPDRNAVSVGGEARANRR